MVSGRKLWENQKKKGKRKVRSKESENKRNKKRNSFPFAIINSIGNRKKKKKIVSTPEALVKLKS